MLLSAVAVAAAFAQTFSAGSDTFDVVAVDVQPWCNNSFRVRMRPANASTAPAVSMPAALYTCDDSNPKAKCAGRNDTGLCMSDMCVRNEVASGYIRGTILGYSPGPAAAPAHAMPLALYWNAELGDNLVGPDDASFALPAPGYKRMWANGATWRSATASPPLAEQQEQRVELVLYWNNATRHSMTTTAATAPSPGSGFSRLLSLGYLCRTRGCGGAPPAPTPPPPAPPVLDNLQGPTVTAYSYLRGRATSSTNGLRALGPRDRPVVGR